MNHWLDQSTCMFLQVKEIIGFVIVAVTCIIMREYYKHIITFSM